MKNKFTVKIAKQVAERSFYYVIDNILGRQDFHYPLETTPTDEFEQNFTEDLEELNITATPKRVEVIKAEYEKMRDRAIKHIVKLYRDKNDAEPKEN